MFCFRSFTTNSVKFLSTVTSTDSCESHSQSSLLRGSLPFVSNTAELLQPTVWKDAHNPALNGHLAASLQRPTNNGVQARQQHAVSFHSKYKYEGISELWFSISRTVPDSQSLVWIEDNVMIVFVSEIIQKRHHCRTSAIFASINHKASWQCWFFFHHGSSLSSSFLLFLYKKLKMMHWQKNYKHFVDIFEK